MKTLKITLVALLISTASFAQMKSNKKAVATPTATRTAEAPKSVVESQLSFEKTIHDFGTLEQGKPETYRFEFTNTTKEPIIITNVQASCGCTATDYSKTPIKPGEKGFVDARYNAGGVGPFNKSITVKTNEGDGGRKILRIKGTVEKKEEDKS